jgi:hypothetical protein
MIPIIERKRKALAKAEAELAAMVRYVQKHCNHEKLAECDYNHRETFSSDPPIRICLECGLTEEGWGCGYKVLSAAVSKIDRKELYRRREGLMITDEMKGPLIRKEVTVDDLIDGKPYHLKEGYDYY